MPNLFRFRHLSAAPEENRNSTAVYAASDGTLKQVASDGTVSDVGGGGGSLPITGTVGAGETGIDITDVGEDGTGIHIVATDFPEQVNALAVFEKPDIGEANIVGGGSDSVLDLTGGTQLGNGAVIYIESVVNDGDNILDLRGTGAVRLNMQGDGSTALYDHDGHTKLESWADGTFTTKSGNVRTFRADSGGIGFNGANTSIPEIPATPSPQDIADVLVALGLCTQAAP